MKTSRTNSFRLHRVSRASSLKKQSQTFYLADQTFKLAAINSVTKGVKNSELSFITGDDLNKLRVQPLVTADSFYQSAHSNLTEVRKRYDQAKKQRVNTDQNIIKLKADIKKYRIFQQQYLDKLNQGRSEVQKSQQNLQQKKILFDETTMQKKVLLNIRQRLKFDKVVLDQRKFDYEKQFSFQNKQLSLLKKDGFYAEQQCDRANKIYDRFLQQLNSQAVQRQAHLHNIENMIQQKKRSNEHNVVREQQIYEIAQRALQDKNISQKQWQNIYLSNVFVSKMLRNKIDKEMEKFSVVEFAFKNIKTVTGVNDAKTLVTKYLNKQAQYGGLLARITTNEKKISELKQQRDFLLAEQKELQIEKQTLQNVKPKNLDISDQIKNYSLISDHERKTETLMSKISSWLNKQVKKINAIEKTSFSFNESKKKGILKNNFAEFCQIINNVLAKCDNKQISDVDTTAGDLSARDSARIARVLPKKSRKNSKGDEIFDVDEEELQPANQYEQKQVLNSQRNQILQLNEKFMKEARKRLQQKRKLNSQKQGGGQKKQKKVQLKKQQD